MEDDAAPPPQPPVEVRKPRIALMGEFSAGKSTLTNLLIGDTRIPMRVTATQLPPVWLSHGTDEPYREDLKGQRYPIDGRSIDGIPVRDTAFIRLFAEAEVLEVCDIIDTPGISDPNMPPEVWRRAAHEADGVIWLTHATQAWRQSEAAVWADMPQELWPFSLLLVTRADKLVTERDRERVMARVRREAGPMFREVLPIALTQALAAGDSDPDLWERSGGAAFSDALLQLIGDLQRRMRLHGPRPERHPLPAAEPAAEAAPAPRVRRLVVDHRGDGTAEALIAIAEGGPPPDPALSEAVRLRVVPIDDDAAALPRRVIRTAPGVTLRAVRPPRP